MPKYRYHCEDCQKEYGVEKPVKEFDDPVPCPHCEKPMKLAVQPVPFRIR